MRSLTNEITPKRDGETVTIKGWVDAKRDKGKLIFLIIRDRKGKIQVSMPKNKVPEDVFSTAKKIHFEDVVEITGLVKKFEKAPRGVEVLPEALNILNPALERLPIDINTTLKGFDIERDTRLDYRILDLRRSEIFPIFLARSHLLRMLRKFFMNNDFIEIQTPKIIQAGTEGGAQLFEVKYFEKTAFLSQSAQLYKEQLTSVFERVYEIGSIYRAEPSRTKRHTTESITLDVEMAFCDMYDVMDLMDNLIIAICKEFEGLTSKIQGLTVNEGVYPKKKNEIQRFTYEEILKKLSKMDYEIEWGKDIPTEAYRAIGKELKKIFWITHWPTKEKPFYIQPSANNPEISESFDLQWGWLELASGGTRIHDLDGLNRQLQSKGLIPEEYTFHTQVFAYGMPPHAGIGLGVDRLLMQLLGLDDIRETMLFPRDVDRLTP